jgi:ABC-type transport system involved in multi-copper enzyme maturation permease subunit
MKFLAILKDSLREAIDAKVFYVMVGLSVLITVLALSLTFTPIAGGRQVVEEFAVLPLNTDADDVSEARALSQLFHALPIRFDVTEATPLDGAPDAASSSFKVKLQASFNTPEAARNAKDDPKTVEQFISERFGRMEGRRVLEPADVHFTGWEGVGVIPIVGQFIPNGGLKGNFELTAHPTPVTFRFWPNQLSLFFGALPLTGQGGFPLFQQIGFIENVLVGYIGSTIAVLISIIISAFFIPNMLRKGSIDLLLVKPISRVALLLYKFVGGLTFIFLNTVVAVCGVWLALGLRSGIWGVSFLETILVLTFFFAILYSVSTLFGVLTRSPIAAILLTVGVWFVFFIIGVIHEVFQGLRAIDRTVQAIQNTLGEEGMKALEKQQEEAENNSPSEPGRPGRKGPRVQDMRFQENWFSQTVSVLHVILPRTNDLYTLIERQMRHDLEFGDPIPPPVKKQTTGTIAKVSGDRISLSVNRGAGKTNDFITKDFTIPDDAKITLDGKEAKLTDLTGAHAVTVTEMGGKVSKVEGGSMLPGGIQLPQFIEEPPNLAETLGVSLAFIAVMLGIACFWFGMKDY